MSKKASVSTKAPAAAIVSVPELVAEVEAELQAEGINVPASEPEIVVEPAPAIPDVPADEPTLVGKVVRSKKGDYDYAITAIRPNGDFRLTWVGPEKPAYAYHRDVSAKALVSGYMLRTDVDAKSYARLDQKWLGMPTYQAHRAAKVASIVAAADAKIAAK